MAAVVSDSEFRGRCDLIFRNAELVDGSGAPATTGDLGVASGRIVAIGDLGALSADREIEAAGNILSPGFIDVHTHDDQLLLEDPDVRPKITQGVTTVVTGNCGLSIAPVTRYSGGSLLPPLNLVLDQEKYPFDSIESYFTALEKKPAATNSVTLVGHSTLRFNAMSRMDRPATDKEIAAMENQMADALAAGAIGLSSGLFYPTARAATTEEIVAIAEPVGEAGGIYATHMRDEGDNIVASIEEAAHIGQKTKTQVLISHHKLQGINNFGRSRESLPLIEKLAKTQNISFDVYPYTASSTVLLPELIDRSERVIVTWSKKRPDLAGRDLANIADELDLSLLDAAESLQPAGAIYFTMSEQDVRWILKHPLAIVGSDGIPQDRHPHPRLWGTFPRVIGRYGRELELFDLEQAIHKMTGAPAAVFGLKDRGLLRPGYAADLVLFNSQSILDANDFIQPTVPANGISIVLTNGEIVCQNSQPTGKRTGKPIRLQQTNRSPASYQPTFSS